MVRIGYHASHEQHPPSHLLGWVRSAERAGFECAMCSDHFHPWSDRQGQSGFAWSWLGAALQATQLPFGVVNAPGQRYSPALVAQAAATLTEMFPDRFWLALGTGQNLNEHITGQAWPPKQERQERLLEAVEVMRSLWAGDTVTHRGHFVLEEARLHTRPTTPPLLVGAALTPKTARWVGGWADALITVGKPPDELAGMVDAFESGGGKGKPMFLQVQIAFGSTDEEAEKFAYEQWRTNVLPSDVLAALKTPSEFDAAGDFVRTEDLHGPIRISADPARHVDWILQDVELGFTEIYLHDVHPDQERFIRVFGERVLPEVLG